MRTAERLAPDPFFKLAEMLDEAAEMVRAAAANPIRERHKRLATLLSPADQDRLVEIMQFFDALT